MIWLKVLRMPIPKLVVTIYHQTDYHLSAFLRPLKCTVRVFIFRSDKFALPFFPSNVNVCFRGLIHSIWRGATKSIKYLVSFLSG